MQFSCVFEFDRLYSISKFHLILFLGYIIIMGKNPGMEPDGMILLLTSAFIYTNIRRNIL